MDFKNRLKGNVTQALVETVLEDAFYRIVPLGIEEVIREVVCLDPAQYRNLGLSNTLRKLPDFFVAKKDLSSSWLVEVKYREQWNNQTRRFLGEQLLEQVRLWSPLYLVLFVKRPARRNHNTPASYLAVCKLTVQNNELGILRQTHQGDLFEGTWVERFVPWRNVTWDSFSRFHDVFVDVTDRWEEGTLFRAIEVVRSLEAEPDAA